MEKSKAFAIFGLIAFAGLGLMFHDPFPTGGDEHDHEHEGEHAAPPADAKLVGGITKLQITDLKVGQGRGAKAGDNLTLHYKGTLLDGTVFDTSIGKAPFAVQLGAGRVIPGWDKGLVGMKAGGKRKLVIPAKDAYGDAGQGKIPPGATLVFEVDLLKIEPAGAPPQAAGKTT